MNASMRAFTNPSSYPCIHACTQTLHTSIRPSVHPFICACPSTIHGCIHAFKHSIHAPMGPCIHGLGTDACMEGQTDTWTDERMEEEHTFFFGLSFFANGSRSRIAATPTFVHLSVDSSIHPSHHAPSHPTACMLARSLAHTIAAVRVGDAAGRHGNGCTVPSVCTLMR